MSAEKDPKTCPECGGELEKEPYEDYLFCLDCGWDEMWDAPSDILEMDADLPPEEDEEDEETDLNLDPEAGEDA